MMLRKKICDKSASDWSNYKENFSDLLDHQQETPKRKRRIFRRKNETIPSISQEIDQSSSDDEKFTIHSSDDVQPFSEDLFSSPVLKSFSPNNQFLIKSTPSGSPILRRSVQKSGGSLIPLSPITPGLKWDVTMNKSEFSVHVDKSDHELFSRDQTTLAIPLEFSDPEIEDEITQVEPKVVDSNTQKDETSITESEFLSQLDEKKSTLKILDTTGTKWLANIKEKIDEEWQNKTSKIANCSTLDQSVSYFDSGKKEKYIKGGLAEQLNRVLKKEKEQKSIFLHRIKTGKILKQNSKSLLLKIISDQKEGILRIIECKKIDVNTPGSSYITLILPDDFISSLSLNLGTNLRLYPPYYLVEMGVSLPNLVLSAYYINSCEHEGVIPGQNSIKLSNESEENSLESNSGICESLLKCLEECTSEKGISVVTTIQRIFCRSINNIQRRSLLCSDAYGTFFVVEVALSTQSDVNWQFLLQYGEGQRVIFNKLSSSGRVTKSNYPALFEVINSIWCSHGQGLMHVNSSQESDNSNTLIMPPSYCYFLHADISTTFSMPQSSEKKSNECSQCDEKICVSSEFNRPLYGNISQYDVLYNPSKLFEKISEIQKSDFFDKYVRFSVICKYVGVESNTCYSQDLFCGEHVNESILRVSDLSPFQVHDLSCKTYNIIVKNPAYVPQNLIPKCKIILKDIYISDGDLIADSCSRIAVFKCNCEAKRILCQEMSS